MKKLEVSEEFVKEAYESACQTWKLRIEKEFPSLFEVKLEVGKWYKDMRQNSKSFFFIEELVNGCVKDLSVKSFGLTTSGEWSESWDRNVNVFKKYFILATDEEIESMLWKEAEKRGYKKGVTISWGERVGVIEGDFYWAEGSNCLSVYTKLIQGKGLNPHLPIMHEGKWSEIIDPNKEIKEQISRLEKELKELKEKVK